MRVRPDSVFVSSILHTIALLFFVRPALWYYRAAAAPKSPFHSLTRFCRG